MQATLLAGLLIAPPAATEAKPSDTAARHTLCVQPSMNVSEQLLKRLKGWGARIVYGYPGDVHTCMTAESLPLLIDRAVRIAKAERCVTCVIIPKDVQELDAVPQKPHEHDFVPTSLDYAEPRVIPPSAPLRRAADLLNAGEKVAMLVGNGAKDAQTEVIAVAEMLSAGMARALLGRAVLPDDLPYVTGSIGLLGMPVDAPLALVLVQHLARDQQSLLPEILARRTAMAVCEVRSTSCSGLWLPLPPAAPGLAGARRLPRPIPAVPEMNREHRA